MTDIAVADAALLALSPGADGNYALTAGHIRRLKFSRNPVVILAACDAADVDINYNPEWSLPVAFVKSGARAVFAASTKMPAEGARAFFQDLLAKLRDGARPAQALRDLRGAWRGRAAWVDDVLLFQ